MGNLAFMREHQIKLGEFEAHADDLAEQGKTPMYFADTQQVLGDSCCRPGETHQ